jgi:quinol monooxygenase YgiN
VGPQLARRASSATGVSHGRELWQAFKVIVIKARARIQPGKRDEAISAAITMATATETEPGNISYTFSQDLNDPDVFHLFEEWDDDESLAAHFTLPHMTDFVVALGEVLDGDMPTTKYVVTSYGPL